MTTAALLAAAPACAQAQEAPRTSLKGKFLVADPSMPDPRFAGTVIFMIEHSEQGAVGVVVNRPAARRPLADILRALNLGDAGKDGAREVELFWGGPVELDKVLALHSDEFKGGATVPAAPGVALSSPKEVFEALAQGRGPAQLLLALGYAGWAKGQLERELAQKGWAVITAGPELIFGEDHAGKWERAWKMRTHEL